ncbi:MAG: hypothetical protein FWG07_02490 [Treponema sp.]|nr:hypothetical protein [Treponema sp.]
MKRLFIPLLLFFLAAELFAQNLTALEKRIVSAGPEEMLLIVMDRNLEKELLDIYYKFDEMEFDEIFPVYMSAFSGTTEEECMVIMLKVALISALGCGYKNGVEEAMDFLFLLGEIASMENLSELPDDLLELMENRYWQDFIAFYQIFDPDVYLNERFPEYF